MMRNSGYCTDRVCIGSSVQGRPGESSYLLALTAWETRSAGRNLQVPPYADQGIYAIMSIKMHLRIRFGICHRNAAL